MVRLNDPVKKKKLAFAMTAEVEFIFYQTL
jgi:hypothetical protein